jgi:hypothetical protein
VNSRGVTTWAQGVLWDGSAARPHAVPSCVPVISSTCKRSRRPSTAAWRELARCKSKGRPHPSGSPTDRAAARAHRCWRGALGAFSCAAVACNASRARSAARGRRGCLATASAEARAMPSKGRLANSDLLCVCPRCLCSAARVRYRVEQRTCSCFVAQGAEETVNTKTQKGDAPKFPDG